MKSNLQESLKSANLLDEPMPPTHVCSLNKITGHQLDNLSAESIIKCKEEEAKNLLSQIESLSLTTLERAIQLGGILIYLKEKAGHGNWTNYIEERVGINQRSASNYMRLFKEKDRWVDSSGALRPIAVGQALRALQQSSSTRTKEAGTAQTLDEQPPSDKSIDSRPSSDDSMSESGDSSDTDSTPPNQQKVIELADGSNYCLETAWNESQPVGLLRMEQGLSALLSDDIPKDRATARQRLYLGFVERLNNDLKERPKSEQVSDQLAVIKVLVVPLLEAASDQPVQSSTRSFSFGSSSEPTA